MKIKRCLPEGRRDLCGSRHRGSGERSGRRCTCADRVRRSHPRSWRPPPDAHRPLPAAHRSPRHRIVLALIYASAGLTITLDDGTRLWQTCFHFNQSNTSYLTWLLGAEAWVDFWEEFDMLLSEDVLCRLGLSDFAVFDLSWLSVRGEKLLNQLSELESESSSRNGCLVRSISPSRRRVCGFKLTGLFVARGRSPPSSPTPSLNQLPSLFIALAKSYFLS